MTTKRRIITIIVDIVILACIVVGAFYLSNYLFGTIPIEGPSMETTVHDGDVVLYYKQGTYKRGDIIVFNTHQLNDSGVERLFIKRIIALGGDTVEIKQYEDGEYYIYVNGERQTEDYLPDNVPNARERDALQSSYVVVPEGCFYYCGDNRLNSSDSRTGTDVFGRIDSILGRAVMRYKKDGLIISDLELLKRP